MTETSSTDVPRSTERPDAPASTDEARSAEAAGYAEAARSAGSAGTAGSAGAAVQEPVPAAVRVQILATEHWSLLATRQLAWTEAFTRATLFLTVLSAAVVAIALVAQAGEDFTVFTVVVIPVVLLLGIATFFRLGHINEEDGRLLTGMNRLRRGYLDIAPDLEPYFVTSGHDDMAGLLMSRELSAAYRVPVVVQIMVSTPVIVAVLDAVLLGVLCAIGGKAFGLSIGLAVGLGVLGGLVLLALLALYPMRQMSRWSRAYRPRFPAE